MKNIDGKWLMTFNDGDWSENNFGEFNTKEELLSYVKETGAKQLCDIWFKQTGKEPKLEYNVISFFIGQAYAFVPSVNADSVLDDIAENASWHGGDYADDYLQDVSKEAREELEEQFNLILEKWIKKHNYEPTFYSIENIENINIILELEK